MRDKLDLQITYLEMISIPMALSPLYKQTEKQKPLSGTGIIASDYLSTIS